MIIHRGTTPRLFYDSGQVQIGQVQVAERWEYILDMHVDKTGQEPWELAYLHSNDWTFVLYFFWSELTSVPASKAE